MLIAAHALAVILLLVSAGLACSAESNPVFDELLVHGVPIGDVELSLASRHVVRWNGCSTTTRGAPADHR